MASQFPPYILWIDWSSSWSFAMDTLFFWLIRPLISLLIHSYCYECSWLFWKGQWSPHRNGYTLIYNKRPWMSSSTEQFPVHDMETFFEGPLRPCILGSKCHSPCAGHLLLCQLLIVINLSGQERGRHGLITPLIILRVLGCFAWVNDVTPARHCYKSWAVTTLACKKSHSR